MVTIACVELDSEACKGCGLCVAACPRGVLELGTTVNSYGHRVVRVSVPDQCTGCGMCVTMCPDMALAVYKEATR